MKRILTAAQMKQADRNTIETMGVPSLVLMERAALSCVEELQNGTWDTGKVLAVCGPGNNGGDGAAIARILKTKGVEAELFCLGNPEKYSEGMRAQKKIAENYGVREVKNPDFREYTVIIDAIFGIGVSRPLAGEYRRAVEAICASGVPVLAVDIPSGIHTDTGEVLDAAVKARATVTFACAKPGLLFDPGKRYAGEVLVRDIGIGFDAGEEETPCTVQWKKKIWTGFLPARRWEIREPSERCWYLPVPVPCAEPLFCVPGQSLHPVPAW